MQEQNNKKISEFQTFSHNIGQSFLLGSAVGIPCYFFHGYRYAPISSKFQAGWQLAKTRGVLLGTNFLVWRLIFETSNYLLKNYRGKDDFLNWAGGGAFVGWILSVRAGPKLGLIWAVIYSGFYQGQYFFNKEIEKLKNHRYIQEANKIKNIRDMNEWANEIMLSFKLYQNRLIMWRDLNFLFLDNFKHYMIEGLSNVI